MVTDRASGSADQANGTTQRKAKINRKRSRVIWTETCNPVPQPDGVVRTQDEVKQTTIFGEKRVAVNGPYVSSLLDHDAVGIRPGINLARMSDVGKTVTKSRMGLIFLANCIGVSSLLATVLGSTTRNSLSSVHRSNREVRRPRIGVVKSPSRG